MGQKDSSLRAITQDSAASLFYTKPSDSGKVEPSCVRDSTLAELSNGNSSQGLSMSDEDHESSDEFHSELLDQYESSQSKSEEGATWKPQEKSWTPPSRGMPSRESSMYYSTEAFDAETCPSMERPSMPSRDGSVYFSAMSLGSVGGASNDSRRNTPSHDAATGSLGPRANQDSATCSRRKLVATKDIVRYLMDFFDEGISFESDDACETEQQNRKTDGGSSRRPKG